MTFGGVCAILIMYQGRGTPKGKKLLRNFKKPIDKLLKVWYNINVLRERNSKRLVEKNFKKVKKPLDKLLNLWYNKYIKRKENLTNQKGLILWKR